MIVLPTGAGKSLVIAMLVKQAIRWNAKTVILQHRKELIEQNAEKLQILLPDLEVGIYSAGLGKPLRRDVAEDIAFAGIQSVFSKAERFGGRELIIIDEAHLVPATAGTMYNRFLSDMKTINHKCRLIGLTATPYRTSQGLIYSPKESSGKLFQGISYEIKPPELIDKGFLSPLITEPADETIDTSEIGHRGQEFIPSEVEKAFMHGDIPQRACAEIVQKSIGRKSVLVFCSGVAHANYCREIIKKLTGQAVHIITGETPKDERAETLRMFRDGEIRWLVNVDVLTTGFDAPNIDMIAVLRATESAGLFAQICGRGLRIAEGKRDCLILDFGGNFDRHGPLDSEDYGIKSIQGSEKKSKAENDEKSESRPLPRQCLGCGYDVFAAVLHRCPRCDELLPIASSHDAVSGWTPAFEAGQESQWFDVTNIRFFHHKSRDPTKRDTLRVCYSGTPDGCPGGNLNEQMINQYLCFNHPAGSFARRKASEWLAFMQEVWPNLLGRKNAAGFSNSKEAAAYLDFEWKYAAADDPDRRMRLLLTRKGKYFNVVGYKMADIPKPEQEEVNQ